jgi:hypothetical protein
VGGLALLGFAGCAGLFYFIYRSTDGVAAVGAEALRAAPEVRAAVGDDVAVERTWGSSNVHVTPAGGNAHFSYALSGGKGKADAEVWLTRSQGAWAPARARIVPDTGAAFEFRFAAVPSER